MEKIAGFIDAYKGGGQNQCRLLLGMYTPDYQLRQELMQKDQQIDNKTAKKLRDETIKKLRDQLSKSISSFESKPAEIFHRNAKNNWKSINKQMIEQLRSASLKRVNKNEKFKKIKKPIYIY